jgi:hypothetical protein
MAATFDGTNLRITLETPTSGLLSMSVQEDIYSDWKVWVKDSGGHQFAPAFDSTGGDPIPGGQFISGSYFLRNDLGWRIQSTDEDQEISLDGNLYPRDSTFPMFDPRATRTVTFNIDRSANPRDISSTNVTEIHEHMGLDAANPKTITENTAGTSYDEDTTNVAVQVRKSGATTTITRQ